MEQSYRTSNIPLIIRDSDHICSWTRLITSRSDLRTLQRQLSSCRPSIDGVYLVPRCRTGSASCTVWSGSLAETHSRFTSVSCHHVSSSRRKMLNSLHAVGKRCDCKSLHWKFSDKRTCDGKLSSMSVQHLLTLFH